MRAHRITITDQPTLIAAASPVVGVHVVVTVLRRGGRKVWLGGDETVTHQNGVEVRNNTYMRVDLRTGSKLWAVCQPNRQNDLHVMVEGEQ